MLFWESKRQNRQTLEVPHRLHTTIWTLNECKCQAENVSEISAYTQD